MNLINGDQLLKRLGMAKECEDCPNQSPIKGLCGLSVELMEVCDEINKSLTEGEFDTELVKLYAILEERERNEYNSGT